MDSWIIQDINMGRDVRLYRYAEIVVEPRLDGISTQVVKELGGVATFIDDRERPRITAYYFVNNEVVSYEVPFLSQGIKWVTMSVLEQRLCSPEYAYKSSDVSFSEVEPGLWGYLNVDNF